MPDSSVVINNAGYTIERAIHGASQKYNDIAPYDYSVLLSLFGGKTRTEGPDRNFRRAHTVAEFEAAWEDKGIKELKEVQVMEVFMDPKDVSIVVEIRLPLINILTHADID